jgi:hypothetical protein
MPELEEAVLHPWWKIMDYRMASTMTEYQEINNARGNTPEPRKKNQSIMFVQLWYY